MPASKSTRRVLLPLLQARLTCAAASAGANCNGSPIAATPGSAIAGARVAGPRDSSSALAAVAPTLTIPPGIHSLDQRLARVADGTLDAGFARSTGHDWDLAAADLLVHEAGGALTTLGGTTLSYNGASTVHDTLVAAGHARDQTLTDLLATRSRDSETHR